MKCPPLSSRLRSIPRPQPEILASDSVVLYTTLVGTMDMTASGQASWS